eukprot:31119-Pelagococcus_subviridis.AAC.3
MYLHKRTVVVITRALCNPCYGAAQTSSLVMVRSVSNQNLRASGTQETPGMRLRVYATAGCFC